jgi:hypothetical protein
VIHPDAEYDGIDSGTLMFSPDSKHVAYGARKGTYFQWLSVVVG